VAGLVDAGDRLTLLETAVAVPPAAADVERFQREADRVEELVAGGARRVGRMPREQITNRLRAANVGLDGRHALRRMRWRLAEQPRHHPRAAHHGRRVRAVGRHPLDRRLREQTTERRPLWQSHFADRMAGERRQRIMPGESVVGIYEVGRHDRPGRQVVADE